MFFIVFIQVVARLLADGDAVFEVEVHCYYVGVRRAVGGIDVECGVDSVHVVLD